MKGSFWRQLLFALGRQPICTVEWRARALKAEARLLEYESAICWDTTCLSCSKTLDSSYAATVRAERAEAENVYLSQLILQYVPYDVIQHRVEEMDNADEITDL